MAEIDVSDKGIVSLKGVELFTNLTKLECYNNDLTALDLGRNTALTYLNCGNNDLTALDLDRNTALTYLNCSGNMLASLNVKRNTELTHLACAYNNLTSLDVTVLPGLTRLSVYGNYLNAMDLRRNPGLHSIYCGNNYLTKLDISGTQIFGSNTEFGELGEQRNNGTITVSMTAAQRSAYVTAYAGEGDNIRVAIKLVDERFADPIFRAYVYDNFDANSDGTLSDSEIAAVKEIDVCETGIFSLKGVELFTKLSILFCDKNRLTALDVSKNTNLTELECGHNNLTTLDVSKNTKLTSLNCSKCQLSSLDVSKNTELTDLYCPGNRLTSLSVSMLPELTELSISDNSLTSLDLTANFKLYNLFCNSNCLNGLDISGTQIFGGKTSLYCVFGNQKNSGTITIKMTAAQKSTYEASYAGESENARVTVKLADERFPDPIFRAYVYENFDTNHDDMLSDIEIDAVTEIDVYDTGVYSLKGVELFTNLLSLSCDDNNLTVLDVSKNTNLTELECGHNNLTTLDVSKNTKLTSLNCSTSQLSSLDVSRNTKLTSLYCPGNRLTSLNISMLPELTRLSVSDNSLTSLNLSANPKLNVLFCNSNYLNGLDISGTQIFNSNIFLYYIMLGDQKDNGTITVKMTAAQQSTYEALYAAESGNARVTVRLVDERFPDPIFRAYVYENFDTNHDDMLSDIEIDAVTRIIVYNKMISSLKGVELFTNLTKLECYNNNLTTLDISRNTELTELNCSVNLLASLDISQNSKLTNLACSYNLLASLDITMLSELTKLWVHSNHLTSLNLSGNPKLHSIYCYNNCLTGLDISGTQIFGSDTEFGGLGNQKDNGTIIVTMRKAQASVYRAKYADIDDNAHVNASSIAGSVLKAPEGLMVIEEEAFANTAFTEVYLNSDVTTIGAKAFRNCVQLEYIEIPGTVTSIADNAFDGCGRLVIAGEAGSAAETFATAHNLVFINTKPLY